MASSTTRTSRTTRTGRRPATPRPGPRWPAPCATAGGPLSAPPGAPADRPSQDDPAGGDQEEVAPLQDRVGPHGYGGRRPAHPGTGQRADAGADQQAEQRREELVLLRPAQQLGQEERLLEQHH